MHRHLYFAFIWTTVSILFTCCTFASDYLERLNLQPLPPSSLLASFNFRSNASLLSFESQHFRFFPRSLAQILQHANTKELHLRFSTGRWDAESWGARPWDGNKEGGTGVELWAWIEDETDDAAFAKWITLTNSLSGLFCASLNFIDSTRTTRPVMSFEPSGHHSKASLPNLYLLHGTLPREVVCTENLTPFLKLLPCKGKAGISSLLDGHKLFDASWQTMAIDVRPICPDSLSECLIEIEHTIDMVLDIERSKRPRDNPIPRPTPVEELACNTSKPYHSDDTCYPLATSPTSTIGWGLSELFGRSIHGACPLTPEKSEDFRSVCLAVPESFMVYTSVGAMEYKTPSSRCYEVPESLDFDLIVPEQTLPEPMELSQPPLYAERSFTGHGQERGGVQTLLTNPDSRSAIEFIYLESLPWFMKPYLHTLKATFLSSTLHYPVKSNETLIKETFYRPALDRHRGTQLELRLSLPPASTVLLTYEFEKAILRYTEYPPDANRGFDVAPAIIRIVSGNGGYIRTPPLLLPLPTPDFSMPYNVIILTSTVMALAFGSMFNLLVRRFVGVDEAGQGLLRRVAERLLTLRNRLQALKAKHEERRKKKNAKSVEQRNGSSKTGSTQGQDGVSSRPKSGTSGDAATRTRRDEEETDNAPR